MNRFCKPVVLILILSQLGCSKSPLGDNDEPGAFSHPAFRTEITDPGALHNEIVLAYNRRRPIGVRTPLIRGQFVQNCIDASNEALVARGIEAVVGRAEIEYFLDIVLEMKRATVYDLTAPATSDIARLPAFLLERGNITAQEKSVLDGMINTLSIRGAKQAAAMLAAHEEGSPRLKMFRSIFEASGDLWRTQITARGSKFDGGPEILSREGCIIVVDATGSLLGGFLAGWPGAIIGGALFSLMMTEEPPTSGGGWTCNDWCDAG